MSEWRGPQGPAGFLATPLGWNCVGCVISGRPLARGDVLFLWQNSLALCTPAGSLGFQHWTSFHSSISSLSLLLFWRNGSRQKKSGPAEYIRRVVLYLFIHSTPDHGALPYCEMLGKIQKPIKVFLANVWWAITSLLVRSGFRPATLPLMMCGSTSIPRFRRVQVSSLENFVGVCGS